MSQDNTSVLVTLPALTVLILRETARANICPRKDFEKSWFRVVIPVAKTQAYQDGEDIYMCYTAFNGRDQPRVALTSIKLSDFLNKNWKWTEPVLILPRKLLTKTQPYSPER